MNTIDYLEAVKRKLGIESDYALAKAYGLPNTTVSNWRVGARQPDNAACFKIAETLGVDPARVIVDVERDRAERTGKTDQVDSWKAWADRLAGLAASVLAAVILSMSMAPGNANASTGLRHVGDDETSRLSARKRRPRRARATPSGKRRRAEWCDALQVTPA